MKTQPYFHILIAAVLFTLYQTYKEPAKNPGKPAAADHPEQHKPTAAVPAILATGSSTVKMKVKSLPDSADTKKLRQHQL